MKKRTVYTPQVSDVLQAQQLSVSGSWCWVCSGFAADFAALQQAGVLDEFHGEVLWNTRTKYVRKHTAPSGREAVYKSFRKLKSFAGFLRLSAAGKEAVNYAMLAAAGFPVATLLAAGEKRCALKLRHCFLMTEMVKDMPDCRDFMPGGKMAAKEELCRAFRHRAGELLGKLHKCGIVHGGFTPFNLLYRASGAEEVAFTMIDVASCKHFRRVTGEQICVDMGEFLRFFDYSAPEEDEVWASYFAAAGTAPEERTAILSVYRPRSKKFVTSGTLNN